MTHPRLPAVLPAALLAALPLALAACGKQSPPPQPQPAPQSAAPANPLDALKGQVDAAIAPAKQQADAALAAAKAEVAKLQEQLAGLKTDLAGKQEALGAKTAAMDGLKKQAESQLAAVQPQIEAVKTKAAAETAGLQQQTADLIAPLTAKLNEYNEQIKKLEGSPLGGLAGSLSGAGADQVAKLKAQRDALAAQIDGYKKTLADQVAAIEQKTQLDIGQLSAGAVQGPLGDQLKAVSAEVSELMKSFGLAQKAADDTQAKLDAAQAQVKQLEAPAAPAAPAAQ